MKLPAQFSLSSLLLSLGLVFSLSGSCIVSGEFLSLQISETIDWYGVIAAYPHNSTALNNYLSTLNATALQDLPILQITMKEDSSLSSADLALLESEVLETFNFFLVNNTPGAVDHALLESKTLELLSLVTPVTTIYNTSLSLPSMNLSGLSSVGIPICYSGGPEPCMFGGATCVFEASVLSTSPTTGLQENFILETAKIFLPAPNISPVIFQSMPSLRTETSIVFEWQPAPQLVDQSNFILFYRINIFSGGIGIQTPPINANLPLVSLQALFPNKIRNVTLDASTTRYNFSGNACPVTADPIIDNLMVTTGCVYPATNFLVVIETIGSKYQSQTFTLASTREGLQIFPVLDLAATGLFSNRVGFSFTPIKYLTATIPSYLLLVHDPFTNVTTELYQSGGTGDLSVVCYPSYAILGQVVGLLPNTPYSVTITPFSAAGLGTRSQPAAFITTEVATSFISDLVVSLVPPGELALYSLNFSAPFRPSSEILFYTIYSCPTGLEYPLSNVSACTLEYNASQPAQYYLVDQSRLSLSAIRPVFVSQLLMSAGLGPIARAERDPQLPSSSASSSTSDSSLKTIVPAVVIPVILVIILLLILIFHFRRKRAASFRCPPADPNWEIARSRIRLGMRLGEGIEGIVYQAKLLPQRDRIPTMDGYSDDGFSSSETLIVAVKSSKPLATHDNLSSLVAEAEVLKRCCIKPHPNVMQLVGVCMTQEPLYIVLEYSKYGNLKDFLIERLPPINSMSIEPLTLKKMVQICIDVASGMDWLLTCRIIHRDIAARNCLVFENYQVKISDFGMCKDISFLDYYRKAGELILPVRWMSPEALVHGRFSHETDIYSMGVLFWEIFSYGAIPFAALNNNEVFDAVIRGERLKCPTDCPPEIFEIMRLCWGSRAPSPLDVKSQLEEYLGSLVAGKEWLFPRERSDPDIELPDEPLPSTHHHTDIPRFVETHIY